MINKFQTSVVGSFPRSGELKSAFKRYLNNSVTKDVLDTYIDSAVKYIVERQESVGLDIISDGEQGRTSFVNFIGERIKGIKPTHITELNPNALQILKEHDTFLPYIRAVPYELLPKKVNLVGDEFDRIRKYTTKPVKITLPSPYLLMWETWHKDITKPYYKEPEDLGYVYVNIIRNEIKRLRDNGLNIVQIDEPMLGNLIEADDKPDRYRKIFGIINGQKYRGFREELKLATDMMNETMKGISGIEKQVHICHWPNKDSPNYGVGIERFIPNIFEMGIDNIVVEYKTDGAGDPIKLVKEYPDNMKLSIGVIDVRDKTIETPDSIVSQVDQIVPYLEPSNIELVPDCGFACGMLHKFPIDVAFSKIESMVKASKILIKKY